MTSGAYVYALFVVRLFMNVSFTCDAKEKLGPGDLFLFPNGPGPGGPVGPPAAPFRFLLLLEGRAVSEKNMQ